MSRRAGSTSTFYSFDSEGNVSQRSDSTGAVQSNFSFSAYGVLLSGTLSDPFGYKAQFTYYTDTETGLQLLTHRYFNSSTGRFLTIDPIGYAGGINLYSYVTNNPINRLDPLGFDGWGNDLADWLDAKISYAERYWQYGDQEWVANGVNKSVADFAYGIADSLRVGSGTGHALYDPDDNGYGRGAGVAQDITRAATLFGILAAPGTRLSGPSNIRRWPSTPQEMDNFLKMKGTCIPDGPTTSGRGKVTWKPSDNVKITFEQHPYDLNAPAFHSGPHWHLQTLAGRRTYVPGDPMP